MNFIGCVPLENIIDLVSIVCAGRKVVQFDTFMLSVKIHSFGVFQSYGEAYSFFRNIEL